ncbi:MAG: DUF5947 family protein [Stellaceae bacterium]
MSHVATNAGTVARPAVFTLRRFVYPPPERCELCRASLPATHAHLLELNSGELRCACSQCLKAFDGDNPEFRAVAPRKEKLGSLHLSDAEWDAFQIPIDLAFLVRGERGLRALYPGPAGIVQSAGAAPGWNDLVSINDVLRDLKPEVEALAIDRVRGRRDAYLLSIDHCYALTGVIRSQWHGLSGGPAVWDAIGAYFTDANAVPSRGTAGHA